MIAVGLVLSTAATPLLVVNFQHARKCTDNSQLNSPLIGSYDSSGANLRVPVIRAQSELSPTASVLFDTIQMKPASKNTWKLFALSHTAITFIEMSLLRISC